MDENSANDQCSYRTSMNTSEPSKSATSDSAYSPPSKLKGCSKYNTQFSLAKMTKFIDTLTKPQKDIVRDCGFGSILALKCSSIPNNVILWLAKHYDSKSRAIKLDGGRYFRIDAITAHQILGVPFGGSKVPLKSSKQAKAAVLQDTNQPNLAPKLDDLLAMVDSDMVGDKFARIFCLIALGLFLCPSSNVRASHHYYEAVYEVKGINKYDWASEVSDCLHVGIMKFHTNVRKGNTSGAATMAGCLFLLVAAYFDYLVVEHEILDQTIPRICVWDDKAIRRYREAHVKIQHIQFKPAESTLFTMDHMNPTTYRGFSLHESIDACTGHCNHQHETTADFTTPSQKGSNIASARCGTIDFESARKVMPGSSDLSLQVLCGEVIHPEVNSFIKSILGTAASTEVYQVFQTDPMQRDIF